MQIVFGGAYNGKRKFVKEQLECEEVVWHEEDLPATITGVAVMAGLDHWVRKKLHEGVQEEVIRQQISILINQKESTKQVWILTDINRGIVPADAAERELRDVIGRLYQYLFNEADRITRIWYGLPQIIKGSDQDGHLHENR